MPDAASWSYPTLIAAQDSAQCLVDQLDHPLLGVGIERLSISPAGVGPVKAMIRSLDLGALRADIGAILAQPTADPRAQYREPIPA